jgi:hypothetical protein
LTREAVQRENRGFVQDDSHVHRTLVRHNFPKVPPHADKRRLQVRKRQQRSLSAIGMIAVLRRPQTYVTNSRSVG